MYSKASNLVIHSLCIFQCGLPKGNPAFSLQNSHSSFFLVKPTVKSEGHMWGCVTSDIVRILLTVMSEYLIISYIVLLFITS